MPTFFQKKKHVLMLFPWPVHLRRFRLSQQHEHAKTRYLYAKFSRFTRFAFQKKRERRNEKTTRIANSVWGVFRQLLNHIKYQLTASIPHYFVDVWSVRRLSLFNVFKSIYSLPLFVQLKFYSQKTGSVKNNWQNRNNRSKGRQTFLLRRHRLQGLQLIRLQKNNDGFVVLWQLFLLVTRYHIMNMGILPTLLCYLYSPLCYEKGRPRAQNGGVNRIWRNVDLYLESLSKNWLACIASVSALV